MAMDQELAALMTEIDANLSHVESVTVGVTETQFNWRSEPGRWSMGECIAHLNMVDGADLPIIRAAVEKAKSAGLTGEGPFEYGFIARKILAMTEPPITRKFKAPRVYIPRAHADMAQTLAEFRRVSAEMRSLMRSANGLDLKRVKTSLPAAPALVSAFLKFPLGARFALLVTHDRRHLWQAEQVRKEPRFPAT